MGWMTVDFLPTVICNCRYKGKPGNQGNQGNQETRGNQVLTATIKELKRA
jgi:hypothetical protein